MSWNIKNIFSWIVRGDNRGLLDEPVSKTGFHADREFTVKNDFVKADLKETKNMARIITTNTGANLVVDGQIVRTYSRARDARRGAARLGYTVA